ncbi:carbohydrate-binding module family 20 domain-containing protein [Pseudomonas arsenicoxydans]|uniref:Carbohydrate-binding protein n=1 Tax=Pseudomonas arsenicoxydans TaxID=702115 RepID=A0A4V0YKF4_9PSED|nr:carbohydrate-binding module family 20 domain-containing protein [Pseudomonas arsenicoxydans]QAY86954.1 carbohydrate-binding protein [Pseudomonas arsenicoxydans]
MFRNRYLLPLGVLLFAMLPMLGDGPAVAGVQWTYLRLEVDFQCNNGVTTQGYSVYVVGAHSSLGGWNPAGAKKLKATPHPTWTGRIGLEKAKPGDVVEWKCIVLKDDDLTVLEWQPGPNNKVKLDFSPVPKSVGTF